MKLSKGQSYIKRSNEKTENENVYSEAGSHSDRPNPRTILLQRNDDEFGFTLRHFIVYPPANLQVSQSKGQVGAEAPWQKDKIEPMDTIFVREVKEGSPAHKAGLVTGDRIITINGEPLAGKTYSEVIDLIYKSGNSLQMLVVPKEDDILQVYFASSAYQPVEREPTSSTHPQLHFTPWSSLNDQKISELQTSNVDSVQNKNHLEKDEKVSSNKQSEVTEIHQKSSEFPVAEKSSDNWDVQEDLSKLQLKDVLCCRESVSLPDTSREQAKKYVFDETASSWEGSCKSVDIGGSHTTLSTYSSARPHRFHDTLSKLLYDMWYHPDTRQDTSLNLDNSFDSHKHYSSDLGDSDEKQDHKSGGIATLISRTMKALVAHPSDFKLFSSETQSSLNPRKANSDSKVNIVSSNGSSEKLLPTTSSETLHNSHSSIYAGHKTIKGKYQKVKPHIHHKMIKVNNHSFDSIDSLDKNKSSGNCTDDQISSLHLVAQRLHLFESGQLAEKSMERTKFYQSELARMSEQSQTPIVSVRTAQFEHFSPTYKYSDSKFLSSSSSSKEKHINNIEQQPASLPNLSTTENKIVVPSVASVSVNTTTVTTTNVTSPTASSGVVYRRKTIPSGDRDDHHIVRRISYLRATARDRIHIDSDFSDDEGVTESSGTPTEQRIKKLKAFFGEKTPKIKQAIDPAVSSEEKDDDPFVHQGWFICKIVNLEGKRASDRSWRPVWVVLQGETFYLLKDKKDISQQMSFDDDDQIIDLKSSSVSIAHDYTKRKHVLRLQLQNKTEYLFQAENHSSMIKWLNVLQTYCLENDKKPKWNTHSSVLEKAAAYEQQIQNNKGRISPLTLSKAGKKMPFRHRSPSGHSPAIKTRRASHGDELALPKFGMIWRDRVSQGWKKVHSTSSIPPKGSSFGVKLEDCPTSESNEHVPWLIETCINIVNSRGLDVVGIYRIPGNNAAVSMLMDTVNQGIDKVNLEDYRWKDVNVVSSLLKAFFRKLPEPLLTSHLYPKFIAASKIEDPLKKLTTLKTLASQLPPPHLETLKLLMKHLQTIVSHSNVNKMEARNLAIVFGPTLVRSAESSMLTMVTDMSYQCYIIETMITYADWLFGEKSLEKLPSDLKLNAKSQPPVILHNVLLNNIHKIDGTQSESIEEPPISSSINQIKAKTKDSTEKQFREQLQMNGDTKNDVKHNETDNEESSVSSYNSCSSLSYAALCFKHKPVTTSTTNNVHSSNVKHRASRDWPLSSFEQHISPERKEENLSDEVVHSYDELSAITQERIRNFEMETRALLQRDTQWPKQSLSSNKVEWEQIEKEWQKAKIEMEQDDIFDHLADDPSNFITILNGNEDCEEFLDKNYSQDLEKIRVNLDKRLQLDGENKTSSSKLFSESDNCSQSDQKRAGCEEMSSEDDSSFPNRSENTDSSKGQKLPACKKSNSSNEKTSVTCDRQSVALPTTMVCSTGYNTLTNHLNTCQEDLNHQWNAGKQHYENVVITATISPSKQTVSTTTIPVIRATVITSNQSSEQNHQTDWNLSTDLKSKNTLQAQSLLQRRHTIASPKIVSQFSCLNHPEMVRSQEDVVHHS
ncbi:rho GTPase-activating protein 21-A-like isoform X3 [Centruroides vittatus]|uniref:rho GTPase-activating protein 21-A-like isoform X3 n=1 Tax=Centruroides vittatus TaxID=120091 RepID=UPI0035105386